MQGYVLNKLLAYKDEGYKEFTEKLIPNIKGDTIIGVRVPIIRKLCKEISGTNKGEQFIDSLPHRFCEENNLHALLIAKINDFNEAVKKVEGFLPYIDNWATCDMLSPKIFKKHKGEILPYINKWINSSHTYTVRFGVKMLMDLFLDEDFKGEYLDLVATVKSDEYYVNMMCAWYFATALAKQYNATLPLLKAKGLPKFIHNKTISKAVESYRINKEQKEFLKTLRIK